MILVTGASGALGRLVTEHLAALPGVTVTAGTRDPGAWNGPDIPVRRVDFDDPATLAPAFDGVDTLVFISAGFAEDDVVHARHRAVVDAAATAGVRHVVYTSLTGTADRLSIALAHRYTERVLAEAPFAVTVLRNALYAELAAFMLAAPALITGALPGPVRDGRVPVAARHDLAEVAARVAAEPTDVHHGRTYELDGVEDLGLADLRELLADAGRPDVADGGSLAALREAAGDAPAFQTAHTVSIFATVSAGLIDRGDSDLPRLLGRAPTPAREVVAKVLASLAG
ncbi:NAD(P)H-binding protein [Phytomonospora sp. NPDC050363]|uniref:NAD(P)H-binding protein n=1 Tax=Phytomonospora sp. NPDC050363 TaxID=3155642 RepID=UPI0033D0DE37